MLLWLTLAGATAQAAPFQLILVSSGKTDVYRQMEQRITDAVQARAGRAVNVDTVRLAATSSTAELKPRIEEADLVVTIGQRAALSILSLAPKPPVLSALIPKYSYTTLLSSLDKQEIPHRSSAIFVDPPPAAYVVLAKLLLGEKRKIGVLAGGSSTQEAARLRERARELGMELQLQAVSPEDKLVRKLTLLLEDSDALLALPDPLIFNRKTARNILLTTYRHRVPVIAASAAYVKAGAMAGIHSSPALIARQAAETIIGIIDNPGRKLPPPAYAKYPLVSINENVARSLGVTHRDADHIQRELLQYMESIR